ncbi:MAG: 7-cyano-7-deazaguanine synthase QueC [Oscillospiraceae bacterium]|nr:7-cyano-7-deazaguanine synthase QueC [Oscillospiraceae bacterium]MCR5166329.1 7-cyano-7-deazaguanine synthase QueC [Oscillospiraceae bacterium]
MRILVLLSGGIDSATCLGMAVDRCGAGNVCALSVSYGQKHIKELESARKLAEHYKVELVELDLGAVFASSDCSLLSHSDKDIPKESYSEQLGKTDGAPVSTYVPFRNGLFLATAASVALSKKCSVIYYGAHADDAAGNAYPDCSSAFNDAMNRAIIEGSGHQLELYGPFVELTKSEVVKKGLELGVPYELTWSCYEGGDKPCGVCGTCRDRAAAFAANGVRDPALAEEDVDGDDPESYYQKGDAQMIRFLGGKPRLREICAGPYDSEKLSFTVTDSTYENGIYYVEIGGLYKNRTCTLNLELSSAMRGVDKDDRFVNHIYSDGFKLISCGRASDNFLSILAEVYDMPSFNWKIMREKYMACQILSSGSLNYMQESIMMKLYPHGTKKNVSGYCEVLFDIDIVGMTAEFICPKKYQPAFLNSLV